MGYFSNPQFYPWVWRFLCLSECKWTIYNGGISYWAGEGNQIQQATTATGRPTNLPSRDGWYNQVVRPGRNYQGRVWMVWCGTVGKNWTLLTENARRWFNDWSPDVRDWTTFKREFADAFPPRRNLGRLLCEAADYDSTCCNTYDAYVHKKTAMLKNLRVEWRESDLVELVVFGIKEQQVKDAAMARDCKTISELLAYLSTFIKRVRTPEAGEPSPRRQKYGARESNRNLIRCHNCGKAEHYRKQCRLAPRNSSAAIHPLRKPPN